MPTLLLRRPPTSLAQGIVTHISDARDSVDIEKARQQHAAYGDIFKQHGWDDVRYVEETDSLPDSVFVEDGVVSVQRIASSKDGLTDGDGILILASPGADARKGEIEGINAMLTEYPIKGRSLASITSPGTLDGGDVLKVPSTQIVYIGASARTNAEGRRQFTNLIKPLGWTTQVVPVKKALHLKSMLTALPDGTIIGYEPLLEDASVFENFIAMPEAEGVAVVHLDPQENPSTSLLMSSAAPKSADILRQRGYKVVTTDISEFEKLEGCVTCLSVRIRPNIVH